MYAIYLFFAAHRVNLKNRRQKKCIKPSMNIIYASTCQSQHTATKIQHIFVGLCLSKGFILSPLHPDIFLSRNLVTYRSSCAKDWKGRIIRRMRMGTDVRSFFFIKAKDKREIKSECSSLFHKQKKQ